MVLASEPWVRVTQRRAELYNKFCHSLFAGRYKQRIECDASALCFCACVSCSLAIAYFVLTDI